MLSRPGGVVSRKMPMLFTLDGAITMATASGSDDWKVSGGAGKRVSEGDMRCVSAHGAIGNEANGALVGAEGELTREGRRGCHLVGAVHVHVDGG
jgi:hypothetical protein